MRYAFFLISLSSPGYMHRFITILLFIGLSVPSRAQELVLSESVPLRTEVAYYLVGKFKDKHLILRERPNEFTVNAYNADMTLGWEKELELPKRRPEILDIWDYDNRFYVLFSHRVKGETHLRMHKYDGGANLVDSTLVRNMGNQFLKPDFSILQSENRRMIQIEKNNFSESREIYVFDLGRMEMLYETTFTPPDFNANADYDQLLIDNEGSSYHIIERFNRRSKKKAHHFAVFAYDVNTNAPRSFQVRMNGRLSYDVLFAMDNQNKAVVGAGYYIDKSYNRANGTFFVSAPVSNPASAIGKFIPFDKTLLETVEGQNKKQRIYLSEIRVKDLIIRRDGGVLIVGEKFKRLEARLSPATQATTTNFGNRFSPFTADFFFDDIFIVAHHPSGDMHWTNFFYKRQYSKNDQGIFSSYFVMKTPSQLRFLFNDEIVQNTTVSAYNVFPDGDYNRKAILNANFQNIKLRFVDSKQVAANEVIVPSEFKSELRLLKVTF